MKRINQEVKARIFESGVKMWQVANRLGIGEATLSRWMRTELTCEKKENILTIIDEIEKEQEGA